MVAGISFQPTESFRGDTVIVEFGGDTSAIDVETFARSLLGFVEAANAINAVVNPGQDIELVIEATERGSFRALIRRVPKPLRGFFSRGMENVFWAIFATVLWENVLRSNPDPRITINTNEVIIQIEGKTVIVPRQVYDQAENARKDEQVQKGLQKTFTPLQADERVKSFTLEPSSGEPVYIPRESFEVFTHRFAIVDENPTQRTRQEVGRLVILKAWLNHAKRKWSFEWNGVPVSAPIKDEVFLDRLGARKFLIGAGDALDVQISYNQNFDPKLNLYVNDQNSYVITRVEQLISKNGAIIPIHGTRIAM